MARPSDWTRSIVIANGHIEDYEALSPWLTPGACVICADGGARHAERLGLAPDVLLGDFDSLAAAEVAKWAARGTEIIQMPPEKDQTDTHLALDLAVQRGAREIALLGATGKRLDHTWANVLLLPRLAAAGVRVNLINEHNLLTVTQDRETVQGKRGDFVSLLPLTPAVTGVTLRGFKYPLTEATLRWGESLGVSNELVAAEGEVRLRQGWLAVVRARD
ncbi:MAG: thiamine diphosphokinase [Symbiobacteriia bacterium]